ncbi:MAG: CBS domain-containing protein [Pseudomonadota bacterium]
MRIKDRLASQPKAPPSTVSEEQMVSDAVKTMANRNYGAMIVVNDDNKVTGIITERDVVKRIVDAGVDAQKTPISDVMTRDPDVAREDDEIEEWMKTMSQKRYRRIPVVDEENRILAILTQTDLVAYSWPLLLARTKDDALKESRRMFYSLLIGGGLLAYAVAMVVIIRVTT